jgi:hypothetical protein
MFRVRVSLMARARVRVRDMARVKVQIVMGSKLGFGRNRVRVSPRATLRATVMVCLRVRL